MARSLPYDLGNPQKKVKLSSEMPRDPRLRGKVSGILSTSPELHHKLPAEGELRHGPVGKGLGQVGRGLFLCPVEGELQQGPVEGKLQQGPVGGDLRHGVGSVTSDELEQQLVPAVAEELQ